MSESFKPTTQKIYGIIVVSLGVAYQRNLRADGTAKSKRREYSAFIKNTPFSHTLRITRILGGKSDQKKNQQGEPG